MADHIPLNPKAKLAQDARVRLVADISRAMVELGNQVQERLTALMSEPAPSRELQVRRDAWSFYQKSKAAWVEGTTAHWRAALLPALLTASPAKPQFDIGSLQLVDTEVVENKIVSSRLVLAVMEKVSTELDDLRLRIKLLEGSDDLAREDILRPEVLLLQVVEQWTLAGMPRNAWGLVNDTVQRLFAERLKAAYSACNELLIQQGVLPTIELKDRVRRVTAETSMARPVASAPRPGAAPGSRPVPLQSAPSGDSSPSGSGQGSRAGPMSTGGYGGGRASGPVSAGGGYDETRMMTSITPLARARSRAQGVLGHLRRFLVGHVDADFDATTREPASPALAAAMAVRPSQERDGAYSGTGTILEDFSPAGVVRVASQLRQQSTALKQKAETKSEKAIIEIVALMFQSILQEDRIPPGIRVWFARLQMPVLRVALEEPDFFGTVDHPARLLIDRMGSCVMGFDASGIRGSTLEAEVKRIVQVIEQYPETGKRVYKLVFDEFQKFLAKFLTEKASTQKVVSVAQQVEQKETLTIQYTIEMRNMFKDMPLRDEIRGFLFKVWAEVLAVAAVRQGPQHAITLEIKKTATDLVWAASAKPNRSDRARVIKELPQLLQRLRDGMGLLGLPAAAQEEQIKAVSDTLADAFLSKTQAIPQAQIDAMAKRLVHLEDFLSEDGMGDLPLDAESIEMMLGIDASSIDVVADGGSRPTPAMQAWAQELQLGSWFTLDHNGRLSKVQFAWRSDRKHLNLFASTDGRSFLIQAGRLAAYLQAGLLLPQEEEALTVRATRDAMAKIEANPERLLG